MFDIHAESIIKGANGDPRNLNEALCNAVNDRAHGLLQALVDRVGVNHDCNNYYPYGAFNPLTIACKNGDLPAVNYLISKGAKFIKNNQAMKEAANIGHVEILKALLEAAYAINSNYAPDDIMDDIYVAFKVSIEKNNHQLIDILMENIKVHHKGLIPGINSLFIVSINHRRYDIAKMLLQKGANPNANSNCFKYGAPFKSILMDVVSNGTVEGTVEMTRALLDHGANPNFQNDNKVTALMVAAKNGDRALVPILLNRGAQKDLKANQTIAFHSDPQDRELLGKTALEIARDSGHADIVIALQDWATGPQPAQNIQTFQGIFDLQASNFLHDYGKLKSLNIAIELWAHDLMKALINKGAEVNPRSDSEGRYPLLVACEKGNIWAVNYLINEGARVTDEALRRAVDCNFPEIAKALLTAATDKCSPPAVLNIPEALRLALECNKFEIAQIILDSEIGRATQFPAVDDLFELAFKKKQYDIAEMLLKHGANSNARWTGTYKKYDYDLRRNDTPVLILATSNGAHKLVKALLKYGAAPNAQDFNGITPLMIAAQIGSGELVKLLLEKGARIDTRANSEAAMNSRYEYYCNDKEDWKILNKTALEVARESNHPDIVTILEDWAKRPPVPIQPAAPAAPVLTQYKNQPPVGRPAQEHRRLKMGDFFGVKAPHF